MELSELKPLATNALSKDFTYFKNFYSKPASYLSKEIEQAIDSFDYPQSFIYDEYPDKVTLQQILNHIIIQIGVPENELWLIPFIEVLLFSNIIERRCRKITKECNSSNK